MAAWHRLIGTGRLARSGRSFPGGLPWRRTAFRRRLPELHRAFVSVGEAATGFRQNAEPGSFVSRCCPADGGGVQKNPWQGRGFLLALADIRVQSVRRKIDPF